MSVEDLVLRLNHAKEVKPRRGHQRSWIAQCPAHDDTSPSLYIDLGANEKVLIKCWSGCGANEIVTSVGMQLFELFPADGYEGKIKRQKKDMCFHKLHCDISNSRRENGFKQSKEDKTAELESFMALRGSH
jgi:DNA primase